MDDNTTNVYNLLQDIFKNVWEQQKYAEVKNGVLLTLNLALFAVLARVYLSISNTINSEMWIKVCFYILGVLFIVHIICLMQSFFPKDSNKEDWKWTKDDINIFFFGDIQKLESPKYLELVIEKLNQETSKINKAPLMDLANQIIKLSEIAQYKYTAFKNAVYRMYLLGSLYIGFFSYLFFSINKF